MHYVYYVHLRVTCMQSVSNLADTKGSWCPILVLYSIIGIICYKGTLLNHIFGRWPTKIDMKKMFVLTGLVVISYNVCILFWLFPNGCFIILSKTYIINTEQGQEFALWFAHWLQGWRWYYSLQILIKVLCENNTSFIKLCTARAKEDK